MSVKLDLLNEQLEGYEASGLSYVELEHETSMPATFFPYDTGFVRVDWVGEEPDQATLDAIQAVITAHDPLVLSSTEVKDEAATTSLDSFANMPDWASWTAQEASDYIDTNVTDLNSAKVVLQKLAMAVIYLRNINRV
jgi:hypothetical protein